MKKERLSWLAGLVVAALVTACSNTNAGLTSKIKTKMAADPVVKAVQIDVDSNNGVVTLTGIIDSPDAKDRAIQIAKETKGVVEVRDMIEVRNPTAGMTPPQGDMPGAAPNGNAPDTNRTAGQVVDDASITMRVKAKLLDDPSVKGLKIDVDTREGVVYLTGSVATSQVRDQAIKLARETEGVKDVQANLDVTTG
ncbi:MAG TPA: BON domain-containing protein [Candidatus Polarisedimenticolaceae bacterium]|nr:BON domain-containing protein [Candidatus Polarisedimenticolaceae bacterium]